MAALVRRGLGVAPFKVGPDFIDPGHHSRITGKTSRNLDGWMLSQDYNLTSFAKNAQDSDMAVVEGVMGLYDGYDGKSEAGSTAQMSKWLGLPVILVVDAKSMARSAAAVIMGFKNFDPGLTFAGVIFNNLGSNRHLQYLIDAVDENVGIQCLGGLMVDEKIAIPERHLGLVTQEDHGLAQETIDLLANIVEDRIDLDLLLENLPKINIFNRLNPLPRAFTIRIILNCWKGRALNLRFFRRLPVTICPRISTDFISGEGIRNFLVINWLKT